MSPAQVIPDAAKNRWLFYILFNGSVVLNSSLDYTINTFLQLKILAQVGTSCPGGGTGFGVAGKGDVGLTGAVPQDGGGLLRNETVIQSSTTYLSITVIDVPNLNPRFLNEPYSGSVPEGCPVVSTPTCCPGAGGVPRLCPDGCVPTGHHSADRHRHGQRHRGERYDLLQLHQ